MKFSEAEAVLKDRITQAETELIQLRRLLAGEAVQKVTGKEYPTQAHAIAFVLRDAREALEQAEDAVYAVLGETA